MTSSANGTDFSRSWHAALAEPRIDRGTGTDKYGLMKPSSENYSASRRTFLRNASAASLLWMGGVGISGAAEGAQSEQRPFKVHQWRRDPLNPILPPGPNGFDMNRCMNPFVVTRGEEYWLFYSGADAKRRQRICLATCPIGDVTQWKRHGPLFDVGGKGDFDELWCVLPCVHRIGGKWHLYYTGRGAGAGGLQSFTGIGLAVSDDLRNWRKTGQVVLRGDGFDEWPENRGIAGGGSIVELKQPDGRTRYRMHYTLATGRPGKALQVNQAKQSVIAHSYDGMEWTDKRVVLRPRAEAPYENAATIALNVWPVKEGWRAIYAGIGTRFGAYSICEATSADGLNWSRGKPGENLSLAPGKAAWENKMVEYPHVVREGSKLRLFYCGNGYGSTGIGTAVADPIA
ncbi:MAG: putative GH43/DUF377 family glycosyl hydrolase [Limisphaerales bacterium]